MGSVSVTVALFGSLVTSPVITSNMNFLVRFLSVFFVVVVAVASTEVLLTENQSWEEPEERSDGVGRLWELLASRTSWISRATSYSSLLTLNVANVLLLGIITIALAYYFGGGVPLGRSLGGVSELHVSSVRKAVLSVMPVVQEALKIYHRLEHSH
ncbi:hypothetical protein Pcinc_033341 [Petrolisthes cinctipes]|uniref:Uncharacterized protein n=1 Tax=Petrolisthes cinctipes TaxID=88211 RepID=A0AAE1K1Z9_PETCI|nr:hypothetical protein Pcinc_033341 [Petrolisthes cinctipes]